MAPGLAALGRFHAPARLIPSTITSPWTFPLPRLPPRAFTASAISPASPTPASYPAAALAIAGTLLSDAYLATDPRNHQKASLHSVYHRPNNWDFIPQRPENFCGEKQHVGRLPSRRTRPSSSGGNLGGEPYYTFFADI